MTKTYTSIIDNQGDNTLLNALNNITIDGHELWIASAYFSLDALNLLGERLTQFNRVRIVFGSDAEVRQRATLLKALRIVSETDLLKQREEDPVLSGLHHVRRFIQEGKLEARVYLRDRFHAKAYLAHKSGHPPLAGILGSGNFTRSGLTKNVELNAELSADQSPQLRDWFQSIWQEAVNDDVTLEIANEIDRHISLYDPYSIYIRALLTWGDWIQGRDPLPESAMLPLLDPHQEDGYRQALNLVNREGGVMICDGVGLGKSFIALALIEHHLRKGESVLLLAPRSILDSSWKYYLREHLGRYRRGFFNLKELPITWFGFRPEPSVEERERARAKGEPIASPTPEEREFYADLDIWAEQAQLIVIDESHNLRRTDSNRFVNVLRMLQPRQLGKKKVVLLTATPLNTDFRDVTAQFRLISPEGGTIGAFPLRELQAEATRADNEARKDPERQLNLFEGEVPSLKLAMHAVAIQRSRATCKQLALERGKSLRFPEREGLEQVAYKLSPLYSELVQKTERDFVELAEFIKAYRAEVKRASDSKDKHLRRSAIHLPKDGLRFSAYLPDRYRREESDSLRDAQVESFLVSLVFTNVMKQLESSIAAFEGILRSLGAGLCARLHHVFGDSVNETLKEHLEWVKEPVRHLDVDDELFESDPIGLSEQDEDYLTKLKGTLHVHRGLAGFSAETHDIKTWKAHIISDLNKLRSIHERAVLARDEGEDEKLVEIVERIRDQRERGRKVLVFTQSVRTAEYLYRELPKRIEGERIERITAAIQGDRRRDLLHAFSPRYNPVEQAPLDLEELGVLISTDVLSEGVNLQEAGCILNYDLHWNPVRLIQRIGRVDRRLRNDDEGHSFSILNVIPPPEIEEIIELVGTVEGRKRKILKLLGLDQSFFSANDEAGTLEEFNKMVDGDTSPQDSALKSYISAITNEVDRVNASDAAPLGAFGVWSHAPIDGFIGVFRVVLKDTAPQSDHQSFGPIVGKPVIILKSDRTSFDSPSILEMLSKADPKEKSGEPRDLSKLKSVLYELRKAAVQSVPNRTQGVTVELVCWMELNQG